MFCEERQTKRSSMAGSTVQLLHTTGACLPFQQSQSFLCVANVMRQNQYSWATAMAIAGSGSHTKSSLLLTSSLCVCVLTSSLREGIPFCLAGRPSIPFSRFMSDRSTGEPLETVRWEESLASVSLAFGAAAAGQADVQSCHYASLPSRGGRASLLCSSGTHQITSSCHPLWYMMSFSAAQSLAALCRAQVKSRFDLQVQIRVQLSTDV